MVKIPVGLATGFGLLLAAAQAGCALICYLSGDHATAHELIGGTTVTGAVVKAGRYLQSHAAIAAMAKNVGAGAALLDRLESGVKPDDPPPASV